MRGVASAAGSSGEGKLGFPARRGAPRTKPEAGRSRTVATQATFVRRGRGRPRSRNSLTSKGQRRAVTTVPQNRGDGDRWPCGVAGDEFISLRVRGRGGFGTEGLSGPKLS